MHRARFPRPRRQRRQNHRLYRGPECRGEGWNEAQRKLRAAGEISAHDAFGYAEVLGEGALTQARITH